MRFLLNGKKETPADAFHFRPHSSDVAAVNDACNSLINDKDDIMSDEFPIPNYWPLIKTACFSVTKQLIKGASKKYGAQLCLMDATYRTTKYALPLYFFLCADKCEIQSGWFLCNTI